MEARNANYATICQQLTFSRRAWFADEEAAQQQLGSAAKPKAANSLYALAVDDAAGGWVGGWINGHLLVKVAQVTCAA